MSKASRPHDEAVIELLREDPAFADEYLAASLEAIDEPGGKEALLAALRQVAEAQGMSTVAERAGFSVKGLPGIIAKGKPDPENAACNRQRRRSALVRDASQWHPAPCVIGAMAKSLK